MNSALRPKAFLARRASALAALAILAAAPLCADRVTLAGSGQVIEGVVLDESADMVVIKDRQMTYRLPMSRVASVERGSSPVLEEQFGDEQLQLGNLEKAVEHYNEAIRLGGPVGPLQVKIDDVERKIENRDLAQYVDQFNAAREHLDAGRLNKAQEALTALMKRAGEGERAYGMAQDMLAQVHYRRAQNLRDEIKYDAADLELRKAMRLDPENASVYVELGELNALSSKTRMQAIGFYLRGLSLGEQTLSDSEKLRVAMELGGLYRAEGDHLNAVLFLRQVYDTDPRHKNNLRDLLVEEYVALAREREAAKDSAAAVAALRSALEVRPTDIAIRDSLASNLLLMNDYPAAIQAYRELLELAPNRRGANYNLGRAYAAGGNVLQARRQYEAEVSFYPDNYDALCDLGDIAFRGADYETAKEYYTRAREAEPSFPRAPLALARTERSLERFPDALLLVDEVLRILPNDLDATLERGFILRDQSRFNEAVDVFTRVDSLVQKSEEPDSEANKKLRANALLARGEVRLLTTGPATANKDFELALQIIPNYPVAYFNIGGAYRKKFESSKQVPDLMKAEENLLKARELDPKNPDFAIALGILYHQVLAATIEDKKGDYLKEAVKNYKEYISNGGPQVDVVRTWIRECGGSA